MLMLMLVAVSCSSSDDAANADRSTPDGDTPSDANDEAQDVGAVVSTVVAVTEVDVPELGAVLEQREIPAGNAISDHEGNQLTIHQWSPWPETLNALDPFANPDIALFGDLAFSQPNASLVALDVEVCASDDQPDDQELFRSRFQALSADAATASLSQSVADPRAGMVFQQVVSPQFVWPNAGECARGWQAIVWDGEAPPDVIRYTGVSTDAANFGGRHLYDWEAGSAVDTIDPEGVAVPPGVVATFGSGSLNGWAVNYLGWARVPDTEDGVAANGVPYTQTFAGTELVAVQAEICAGERSVIPSIGLQIDGWNLVQPFRRGAPWGPGFAELAMPTTGECAEGWVPFAIPVGSTPTGFFVTDSFDPVSPWFEWRLSEVEAPQPVLEGFPGPQQLSDVRLVCGVEANMQLDLGDTTAFMTDGEFDVQSAVGVRSGVSQATLYFSTEVLTPSDLPTPESTETEVVAVELFMADGTEVTPGLFSADLTENQFGEARILRGDGGTLFFSGTEVAITAVTDDIICGEIFAGEEVPQLAGPFGAVFWEPPGG